MNEQVMNKLAELAGDKSFTQALGLCRTNEDTLNTFARFGIAINAEDLSELLKVLRPQAHEDGELSEDSLEDVAGGAGIRMAGGWSAATPLIPRITPLLPVIRWTK